MDISHCQKSDMIGKDNMRKYDLADVCNYMRKLVVPHMPDDFKIADKFRHSLTDYEIREGITAFRKFLYTLFDKLAADKDIIDVKTRDNFNPYVSQDKTGIRVCFPTIYDLSMILFTLGTRSNLVMKERKLTVNVADLFAVICEKTEKYISFIKMSNARKLELFNILSDLGMCFSGIDFSEEVDFFSHEKFVISFDKNDFFVIGLKLLAEATNNHKHYYYIMNVFTVLLQCDFYPLANAKPKKHIQHIDAYANTQSPEISEWIKNTNKLLMGNNCTMARSNGAFQYTKWGKSVTYGLVCIIRIDITGCFITPGVNHLTNPNNIINMLPDNLVNVIINSGKLADANSEQCYRELGNMGFARYTFLYNGQNYEGCRHAGVRCQFSGTKCRFGGYSFDLTDSFVRELMEKWIELEITAQ